MRGVNLRHRNGNILVGIKTDEFIDQLKAHTDEKGWCNFVIMPLQSSDTGHAYNMLPDRKQMKHAGSKG